MTLHHRRAKEFLQGTISILVRIYSFYERSVAGWLAQARGPSISLFSLYRLGVSAERAQKVRSHLLVYPPSLGRPLGVSNCSEC